MLRGDVGLALLLWRCGLPIVFQSLSAVAEQENLVMTKLIVSTRLQKLDLV